MNLPRTYLCAATTKDITFCCIINRTDARTLIVTEAVTENVGRSAAAKLHSKKSHVLDHGARKTVYPHILVFSFKDLNFALTVNQKMTGSCCGLDCVYNLQPIYPTLFHTGFKKGKKP